MTLESSWNLNPVLSNIFGTEKKHQTSAKFTFFSIKKDSQKWTENNQKRPEKGSHWKCLKTLVTIGRFKRCYEMGFLRRIGSRKSYFIEKRRHGNIKVRSLKKATLIKGIWMLKYRQCTSSKLWRSMELSNWWILSMTNTYFKHITFYGFWGPSSQKLKSGLLFTFFVRWIPF